MMYRLVAMALVLLAGSAEAFVAPSSAIASSAVGSQSAVTMFSGGGGSKAKKTAKKAKKAPKKAANRGKQAAVSDNSDLFNSQGVWGVSFAQKPDSFLSRQ